MSGLLTPLGVFTLGQALPGLAILDAFARAADATARVQLLAQLKGLLNVSAALTIPPLPSVTVVAAAKVAAQLAINPSIAAPSLQLSANAKLLADIQAKLGITVPAFDLGAAGIAAYHYEGAVGEFSGKLGNAIGGGLPGGSATDVCFATVLVTTAPAAAAALAEVLV
jgi:hypothetical protein